MNVRADLSKLLARCKKNDPDSQKQVYELFAPKMLVVALRYSKTTHEAEDIIQESFLKVFNSLKTLRETEKVEGWIKRIVVNTALNQNRSKLYMFPMTELEEDSSVTEEDVGLHEIHFQELIKLIQSLPSGCQMIFNLYAIEGFSHKEIAGKLGISEGTSKSQYSRARSLLQEKLGTAQSISYGAV